MKKLLVSLSTIGLLATGVSAQANEFSVSIVQTTNLAKETTLSVAVANAPAEQGFYLMLCEGTAASPRPANCSTTHQAWLTTAASSLRMGATPALPVNEFKIASEFETRTGTKVNCEQVKCGVFVRRDHFAGTDTTLDRFIPITFAAPVTAPRVAALVGSFNNRVAVRVWGAEGSELAIKIGGRWIKSNVESNNQLLSFRAGGNVNIVGAQAQAF